MKSFLLPGINEQYNSPSFYYTALDTIQILNSITIEPQTQALNPNEDKAQFVTQLISKLFPEVSINRHGLLICQHQFTKSYNIYFVNTNLIPVSFCCNQPVQVKCYPLGFGLVLCSALKCPKREIGSFKFHDVNPDDEDAIHRGLSKLITVGCHKYTNLIRKKQQLGCEVLSRVRTIATEPNEPIVRVRAFSTKQSAPQNILKRPFKIIKNANDK